MNVGFEYSYSRSQQKVALCCRATYTRQSPIETTGRNQKKRPNPTVILKEAAATYKVDTEAITTKVRQEFAAKEKARRRRNQPSRPQRKQPKPTIRGAVNQPPLVFLPSKIGQEDTALVSPCTPIPPTGPRPPVLRGRSRVPPPAPFP